MTPHPEDFCHRCGGPNISWYAPSPLWNVVMGYPDQDFDGIVCPVCFAKLAEAKGIYLGTWRVSARDLSRVTVTLPTVHVDGRIWNPETDLWEDPDPGPPEMYFFEKGEKART